MMSVLVQYCVGVGVVSVPLNHDLESMNAFAAVTDARACGMYPAIMSMMSSTRVALMSMISAL